jgi:hypothetical protein
VGVTIDCVEEDIQFITIKPAFGGFANITDNVCERGDVQSSFCVATQFEVELAYQLRNLFYWGRRNEWK